MDEDDIEVDPSALDRIRHLGGQPLLNRLIDLFTEQVPRRLDQLELALVRGDLQTVGDAAHSLKSTAGNLGAWRMRRAAAEVEQQAERGNAEAVGAVAEELRALCDRAAALLANARGKETS